VNGLLEGLLLRTFFGLASALFGAGFFTAGSSGLFDMALS